MVVMVDRTGKKISRWPWQLNGMDLLGGVDEFTK